VKKSIVSLGIMACTLSSTLFSMEEVLVFKRMYSAGNYDPVERNCVLPVAAKYRMADGSSTIQKLNTTLPQYQGELLNILIPSIYDSSSRHWNAVAIELIYPEGHCNKTNIKMKALKGQKRQ